MYLKGISCNFAVPKNLEPEVVQDLKEIGGIDKGEIKAIGACSYCILNANFDPKNVDRFDKQIENEDD